MNHRLVLSVVAGVLVAFGGGYVLHARADGVPSKEALSYVGVLEDAKGPIQGPHNIQVLFYDAATNGNQVCQSSATPVSVVNGRFSVTLPEECTTRVSENPNLWINVLVDGSDTGRAKIGAVPYAMEANHSTTASTAQAASGTLAQQVVPAGAVMAFNLDACPAGWSVMTSAGGRTIVGVNPAGGNGLSQRSRGATVGEEMHTLSISEMPSHNHTPSTGAAVLVYNTGGTYGVVSSNVPQHVSDNNSQTEMKAQGGGQAHNNMQPSLALLYCVKN